jgi:hypothetical protein
MLGEFFRGGELIWETYTVKVNHFFAVPNLFWINVQIRSEAQILRH